MSNTLDTYILQSLFDHDLITSITDITATQLTGGVSSDIWKVEGVDGPLCVKRALGKLKVEDDWFAPVSRNASEVAWLRTAQQILPDNIPSVLLHDEANGYFVMPFYDPDTNKNWKQELQNGRVDLVAAQKIGQCLAKIHSRTSNNVTLASEFSNDATFLDIRLEPYLLATAKRHQLLAERLHKLSDITASTKHALVHGDASPKNILLGPEGPLFIDAECAWYGAPSFDLAFGLNHLLLKCLWVPSARSALHQAFRFMCDGYVEELTGLNATFVMTQTAHLLPGLMLARVDGKSPVEYIVDDYQKDLVRDFATKYLLSPLNDPFDICHAWHAHLMTHE